VGVFTNGNINIRDIQTGDNSTISTVLSADTNTIGIIQRQNGLGVYINNVLITTRNYVSGTGQLFLSPELATYIAGFSLDEIWILG
jgi:hypothetical protein